MASAPQAERPVGVRIPVRDGSRGRLTQRLPMALAVGVSETPAWTYQLWEAQVRVRHSAARRRSRRLRARSFDLSLPQWKRLSWGEGCHPPPHSASARGTLQGKVRGLRMDLQSWAPVSLPRHPQGRGPGMFVDLGAGGGGGVKARRQKALSTESRWGRVPLPVPQYRRLSRDIQKNIPEGPPQ